MSLSINKNPSCTCHKAYPELSKIIDLLVVSKSLNKACRDGCVKKVQTILEKQGMTGRLDYLLQGVRTNIHGDLLKNSETRGLEEVITYSPIDIAKYNYQYDAGAKNNYAKILSILNRYLKK